MLSKLAFKKVALKNLACCRASVSGALGFWLWLLSEKIQGWLLVFNKTAFYTVRHFHFGQHFYSNTVKRQ